jgi:TRAP-type C4-dicarboxylate transport system permease small subunit
MRWLKGAANVIGGGLFLTLFLVFVLQVIARFLFNKPMAWTDEAAVILYVWIILWGCAVIVPEREHVMFDLLWNNVGRRTRQVMKVVGNLMIGGLALAALPATWDYVHFMGREGTPVLNMPFSWVFLPFVFLMLALTARSAAGVWDALRGVGLEAELHLS